MQFTFTVRVEVNFLTGKFEARDSLQDQLREAIEGADPGTVSGDNGGEYEVSSWEVDDA